MAHRSEACTGCNMEPSLCMCAAFLKAARDVQRVYVGARLDTLASNLAIGAGLCAAFRHGFDEGWDSTGEGHNGEYTRSSFTAEKYEHDATVAQSHNWRPGCQRSVEVGGE